MDMPSVVEMSQQLAAMRTVTRFVARKHRHEFLALEAQLQQMMGTVDRFYMVLGPKNWILHDSLNFSAVEKFLQGCSPEEAEEQMVALHASVVDRSSLLSMRLRHYRGFRSRAHQIERAIEHFAAKQYDSCVLTLIAVVDGFVNDFDPADRKGLHAREPDSMVAWDSVVGHHMGLTNVLKTFTKSFKKRVDDEVSEVYRNGIMHGMITRFDNPVVAAKAFNLLAAVRDWAEATEKSKVQPLPKPTLRAVLRDIGRTAKQKQELEKWSAITLSSESVGFEEHEMMLLTRRFLELWAKRNFGALTELGSRMSTDTKSKGAWAGELRDLFDGFRLDDFKINEIENTAPAIWLARGTASVNGKPGDFECRWVSEDRAGQIAYGVDDAKWKLVLCDPGVWQAHDDTVDLTYFDAAEAAKDE